MLASAAWCGWNSWVRKDGKLKHYYNDVGITFFFVEATEPIPAGKHQARMEFAHDGGGLGRRGTASLYVDGSKVKAVRT